MPLTDFLFQALLDRDLQPIPGSPAALREAAKYFKIAVVSSSPVKVINRFVEKFQLEDIIPAANRMHIFHLSLH